MADNEGRHRMLGDLETGPFTITGEWVPVVVRPKSVRHCLATPCPHCGGCATCGDFHGTAYGGCTEETCPLLRRTP